MKPFNLFVLGIVLSLILSCDNSDFSNNTTEMNLEKIVTFSSNTGYPTYNTTNVKHYINNKVVSDSTFDYQDEFWYRTEITNDGLTKIYKTYSNNGELTDHWEENYDSQGRLVGRHTFEPMVSALFFTYIYNSDGTVTSKYYDDQDNTTTVFRTFTKNADGLIYKENGIYYNLSTNEIENYEGNASYQNQEMISTNYSGTITTFEYYPNQMPTNIQKSINELNNLIVMGNELRYLALYGNSYYKKNNTVTTFNSDNYKTHSINTYIDTTVVPNTTSSTEKFYYYN